MASFHDGIQAYTVDKSARNSVQPRVLNFSFGDGYEQRLADGINTLREEYDVTFKTRYADEIENITDFLETMAGVDSFVFSPPNAPEFLGTATLNGNTITGTGFNSTVLSKGIPDGYIITNTVNGNDNGYIVNSAGNNNDTVLSIFDDTFTTENTTPSVSIAAGVLVICSTWNEIYNYQNIHSLSAKFKRVYD